MMTMMVDDEKLKLHLNDLNQQLDAAKSEKNALKSQLHKIRSKIKELKTQRKQHPLVQAEKRARQRQRDWNVIDRVMICHCRLPDATFESKEEWARRTKLIDETKKSVYQVCEWQDEDDDSIDWLSYKYNVMQCDDTDQGGGR